MLTKPREAFVFSLAHICSSSLRSSSHPRCCSRVSRYWRRELCTCQSRPVRSSSLTVVTNLASKLRVKVWPGLSTRMRMSMIALYWVWSVLPAGSERYLRMRKAASLAALGLDSAASTILGRWTNSFPCWSAQANVSLGKGLLGSSPRHIPRRAKSHSHSHLHAIRRRQSGEGVSMSYSIARNKHKPALSGQWLLVSLHEVRHCHWSL